MTRSGYCECGCGEQTTVPDRNYEDMDMVKGRPMRFVRGHNTRVDNPNGNDGFARNHGYRLVHVPDHPQSDNSGYVPEHRLVAESALGYPVPNGSPVHHVNGVKDDNRHTNLVVCEDQAYHKLLHARADAMAACGNPDARRCWICGEWDVESDAFTSRYPAASYHKACAARYARERRTAKRLATEVTP